MPTMNDESEIMREISWVYMQLSPENLACDGEITDRLIAIKRSRLNAKLKNLESKLGRKVSASEALNWAINNPV